MGARYPGGLAKGAVGRVRLRGQGLAGQTLREQGLVRQTLREQGLVRQTPREQGLVRETLLLRQYAHSQGKEQGRAGTLVGRWLGNFPRHRGCSQSLQAYPSGST
jgi:hypothetical protein